MKRDRPAAEPEAEPDEEDGEEQPDDDGEQQPDDEDGEEDLDELRAARPPIDRPTIEQALARAEQKLFGASTTVAGIDRFVVLKRLGAGGMGVVYEAYDPKLDRRVALKVVHPRRLDDEQARDRMLAEARALARLEHPNVVPVYELVTTDEQMIMVMELIEGQDLDDWQREGRRTWRAVLAIYQQAGAGLAASHAHDVVHRDFKPSNARIGKDGRVRVIDFGLARAPRTGGQDGPSSAQPQPVTTAAVTVAGQISGTIRFMAPEQLAEGIASPAADQFSFCVSLYGALYGAAPFDGDDAAILLANASAGRVREPPAASRVPRWLRALVVRGLAADPAARHPTMAVLLDRIERERVGRRRRWVVAAAVVAAGLAVAVGMSIGRTPGASRCGPGAGEVAGVWNPAQRRVVARALAVIPTPYAAEIVEPIAKRLDVYGAALTDGYRNACKAHLVGGQSDKVFDLRTACLDRRLRELADAVGVLAEIDARTVTHAFDVVANLSPPSTCDDRDALEAATPPPATLAARVQVAAVRALLSEATARDRAGRSEEALRLAKHAYGDARLIDYAPAIIEAGLLEGRIHISLGERKDAIDALRGAQEHALAIRALPAAIEAAARRLYVEGLSGEPLLGLDEEIAILDPLSKNLQGDHFARPLLLNNLGSVYMARHDRDSAQAKFQAALDALPKSAPDLELTSVGLNLAMVTPEAQTREDLAQAAWERRFAELGESHLETLEALLSYGRFTLQPVRAREHIDDACVQLTRFHPDQLALRASCGIDGAFLADDLGDRATAATRYDEVAQMCRGATVPVADRDEVTYWGPLAAAFAELDRGNAGSALARFDALLGTLGQSTLWWERLRAAHAQLGAGLAAAHVPGQGPRAARELEQAIATYREAAGFNENVGPQRRLAMAEANLAAVLRAQGGGGDRADELDREAADFHRRAGYP